MRVSPKKDATIQVNVLGTYVRKITRPLIRSKKAGAYSILTFVLRIPIVRQISNYGRESTRCELSGGCPFGADLGDWSYHTSVFQDHSE
jgi:hypothetical protein